MVLEIGSGKILQKFWATKIGCPVCTSRNRLPAAVTEAAITLRLSLHNFYKELTGGQDKTLQPPFHHSTQKLPQCQQGNNKNLLSEPYVKTLIFSVSLEDMTSLLESLILLFDGVSFR